MKVVLGSQTPGCPRQHRKREIMKTYKITETEEGESFIWTAEQVLEEVNRDRSDEWQDYTLEDLEEYPDEVLEWIEHLYIVEEVAS